ncbi:MAG TPA: hypothetical protein VFU22_11070 [Roseiflexaceae bacterium]|nr:hypothetical protein [Roseiflexaceae bacterium]
MLRPKEYETFAEQKLDQRIGFIAFPIVNAIVWVVIVLLTRWVDSITIEPTVRHPNLRLAITLLPWVVNGLVLLWAAIFRRYIASGYLICLGGLLVVGTMLGLIGVVSFFLAVPLTALIGSAGALLFMILAIIASTWLMFKIMPMFRNWWKL